MNISRTSSLARLSPLTGSHQGKAYQVPAPPEQSGDEAHLSTRVKVGAGVMLGLTLAGIAGGMVGGAAAPQAMVQLQSVPSQSWISTSDEVAWGKQTAQQVEKETKLWANPEAQARLESIGQRLALTSSRPDIDFTFKLLDTDAANAFALPGGTVYATRALMQKFTDDDQLAFVLGHEIAHVELRHSERALNQTLLQKLVTLPIHFRQWPIARAALNAGD